LLQPDVLNLRVASKRSREGFSEPTVLLRSIAPLCRMAVEAAEREASVGSPILGDAG
jgi:hypothetical protein